MANAPATNTALLALAPAYWRILLIRVPHTAADRLARDIRSGLFDRVDLHTRARDLSVHPRGDIRARARTEVFPALGLDGDGLEPNDGGQADAPTPAAGTAQLPAGRASA